MVGQVTDAALQLQQRFERRCWQCLQLGPLGRERLGDVSLRRAVDTHVGNRGEPLGEPRIEVVEVAETAREEEVLVCR